MSIQEVILLFADVVKEAMPFVVVFFFGGYIVKKMIDKQEKEMSNK